MTLLECYRHHFFPRMEGAITFGENIDKASCISGLGKNLSGSRNVGNCELTHIGAGFGVMMDGGHAVLIAKQLDFMLLGLDHMVNTLSFARSAGKLTGSFSIVTYLCNQGYQGPQSSLVDLSGFCSLGGFPGYLLQEENQIADLARTALGAPGFRIFVLPQRIANEPVLSLPITAVGPGWRMYGQGQKIDVVSCHATLAEAVSRSRGFVLHCDCHPDFEHPPFKLADKVTFLDDGCGTLRWADFIHRKLRACDPFVVRPRNHAVNPDSFP